MKHARAIAWTIAGLLSVYFLLAINDVVTVPAWLLDATKRDPPLWGRQ